jgi:hypothetical protein
MGWIDGLTGDGEHRGGSETEDGNQNYGAGVSNPLEVIAELKPLVGYVDDLKRFAKNPVGIILGLIASVFIDGVLEIVELMLEMIQLVLIGSKLGYSEDHSFVGLEDVPLIAVDLLIDKVGRPGGNLILDLLNGGITTMVNIVSEMGILGFPVAVAMLIAILLVLEQLIVGLAAVSLGSLPVAGPLYRRSREVIGAWL